METFNLEQQNVSFNAKEELKKGNIENALASLGNETKENVEFTSDLNRVGLEIHAHQTGENGQEFIDGMNSIFAQFLTPQNNIA